MTESNPDGLVHSAHLDPNGVVISLSSSNVLPQYSPETPGMVVEISAETYAEARARVGRARLVGGALQPYTPPEPEPQPVTQVHGAYLRAALAEAGDLDRVYAAHADDPIKLELFRGATSFSRGEPDLEAGATALAIDLDERFARADEIRRSRGG